MVLLWSKYKVMYWAGIWNTLKLAFLATLIGCFIGLLCGVLNTIPYTKKDPLPKRFLLKLLRMQGYYNAFAIVTGENKASHEFHKRMGFTKSFVEKHSGYKFGRWLDVVYWQYPLRTGDAPPEPVRYRLTEAEMVSILGKVNL